MKEIILVGDKVLIKPQADEEKTESGLYLPQGVKEKDQVQIGKIIKTGPGYPVPDPSVIDTEPWAQHRNKDRYFPLQAQEGDFCIFLRKEAIEIKIEKEKYLVVPHSAILVLVRQEI